MRRRRVVVFLSDSETEEISANEDEDMEVNTSHKRKRVITLKKDKENNAKDIVEEENYDDDDDDDDDVEACELFPSGCMRKKVVSIDSEDEEDNIPISILKNLKPQQDQEEMIPELVYTPVRQENGSQRRMSSRLREQRDSEQNSTERLDDETEEEEVEEESESLDGFIVDDDETDHSEKSEESDEIENEESDVELEDNIPVSTLKNLKPPQNQEMIPDMVYTPIVQENRSQRRMSSRLRKKRDISPSTERLDDETEEEEGESESLDGFIVDDEIADEESDGGTGNAEIDNNSQNSVEIGDEETAGEAYVDIMSRLRRDKKPENQKWEYQTDMLADFGKDPELCMRAVCVLYRFQTEDEKMSWSTHVDNGRGFSKFDATRGCRIGKFLTDGDPYGDLTKSVEELKDFEVDGVEVCRDLAYKYSNQLFQIYNNQEDAFFSIPPSP